MSLAGRIVHYVHRILSGLIAVWGRKKFGNKRNKRMNNSPSCKQPIQQFPPKDSYTDQRDESCKSID